MAVVQRIKSIRLVDWWIIAAVLAAIIAVIAPHQLGVTAYKLSLVALAAIVGYHVDRSAFPGARPHLFAPEEATQLAAAWIRRAIIIAAAMIAVSLGA